jgi:putative methionine-R-sulfoxide reductase with GAF domain
MKYSSISRVPSLDLRRFAQAIRLSLLILVAVIVLCFIAWVLPAWLVIPWAVGNLGAWLWEFLASPTKKRGNQLSPTPADIFERRHKARWVIFIIVTLLNFILLLALAQADDLHIDLAILFVTAYSLLTFAWLAYEAIRWSQYGQKRFIWLGLSFVLGLVVFFGLYRIHNELPLSLGIAILYGVIAIIVYLMQRLGVEDRVQNDILRKLIVDFLGMDHTRAEWTLIVKQIEERLRFERVFILEPNPDRSMLVVVAEAGNYPSVIQKEIPIQQGITGKVFQTGQSEGWNDISKCKSYNSLVDGKLDDTRAEIAVPIRHLGVTYGVLDVQDKHSHVFRWDDVYTLEVIARILGAAISAEKTDLLIQDAHNLWEELSSHSFSEEAMFQEFAQFAQEKLGADVITYYPLSPTGYPTNRPLNHGTLFYPERMYSGIQSPRSPLVQLIRDWKPFFADRIYPDSVFARFLKTDPPSFTIREKIESVCFVPVGTRKEYLGAMFLNYRKPRTFDGLFRFMVLSFSQTFAILASRERYKSILFEGFGRPELGVHNLFSRYGLKKGVREEGEKIFQRSCAIEHPASFADCGMSPLLQRVDEFLRAVSLAQSSIPPMFLNETLTDEAGNFISTLPAGRDGRRPFTQIDIDPRIERESPWSKLALYRLITESMNNAVFHGETNEIKVTARREHAQIVVQISNNGNPLPIDSDVKHSRRGIYSLLSDLELKFGASTSISRGLDGTGTIVEAAFPALPLTDEV